MLSDSWNQRFGGIARLYGEEALRHFSLSHVAVVGLGGVGSWVVEALARSGVGELTLMDFDDICISNTNRQVQALTPNAGQMKTRVLASRLKEINPEIKLRVIEEPYSQDNREILFDSNLSLIVDAVDDSPAKFDLAISCRERNLSLVMAGAAGGRRDPGLLKTEDLAKTREDKMLSLLRKRLRQKAGFPRTGKMGVTCVYSLEKPNYLQGDGCISQDRPDSFLKPLDCSSGFGTSTPVTGSFGFLLAAASLQELLKGLETASN